MFKMTLQLNFFDFKTEQKNNNHKNVLRGSEIRIWQKPIKLRGKQNKDLV